MDRKIQSQTKHIEFLNEELEIKEKEIVDLKEYLKNADKLNRKKTVYAEEILNEKCVLSQELRRMEKDMFELKKQTSTCQNGCEKYNRSMDDIVTYAEKNKTALMRLKTLAEDQKIKISNLREDRKKLMEQIETQEEELEEQNRSIVQLVKDKKERKEEAHILKQTSEDLKDEIKSSCEKIKNLEELAAQNEFKNERKNSSGDSLADELGDATFDTLDKEELHRKVEASEDELELSKREVGKLKETILKNEAFAEKRLLKLQLIEKLSQERNAKISKIQAKLKSLAGVRNLDSTKDRCRFGWKCQKGPACQFEHSFLYTKINKTSRNTVESTSIFNESNFLCDICGNTFSSKSTHQTHIQEQHGRTNSASMVNPCEKTSKRKKELSNHDQSSLIISNINEKCKGSENQEYSCKQCAKSFRRVADLKNHEKNKHDMPKKNKIDEIKKEDEKSIQTKNCNQSDLKFVDTDLLKDHMINIHEEPPKYNAFNLNPQISEEETSEIETVQNTEEKVQEKSFDCRNWNEFKCEVCKMDFTNITDLDDHMDNKHAENINSSDPSENKSDQIHADVMNMTDTEQKIRSNERDLNQDTLESIEIIEVSYQEAAEKKTPSERFIDYRKYWEEFECEVCKKDCKHLEELDNHMDTKHSKYIKCGICEITFQEIREMNVHIDEEHDGSGKLNDPGMLREGEKWA